MREVAGGYIECGSLEGLIAVRAWLWTREVYREEETAMSLWWGQNGKRARTSLLHYNMMRYMRPLEWLSNVQRAFKEAGFIVDHPIRSPMEWAP